MEIEELFLRASEEFEDRNYQQGLDVISQCIKEDPQNSMLYSNRGLFFAQLGENDLASKDLDTAIKLNHLNYVAYFNLFSLQFRSGEEEEAFSNLCCSLSSLYLLRAKKSRRELDVQRAISYADNNFQAYILKSMMYLEDGHLSQALNYMEWACDLNPNCILSKKLKNIIAKKLDPYAPQDYIQEGLGTLKGNRLKSSYRVEQDFQDQVAEKVKEFIDIYNQMLGQEGTVTQKVPRILPEHDRTLQKSRFSDISGIYEFKLKTSRNGQILNSRAKGSQPPTKEQLPQENNREYNLLQEPEDQLSIQQGIPTNNKIFSNEAKLDEDTQQNLLDGSAEKQQIIAMEAVQPIQVKQKNDSDLLGHNGPEQDEILLDQEPKQIRRPLFEQKKVEQQLTQPGSRKQTVKSSKVSSEMSSQSASLYPITNRKKIQFTVIGAQIRNPDKFKDLYLTGNYNSRKGQRLRTQIKKIDGNQVQWFSINPPTPISQKKQTLSVKLFSKQYFSVNDELIGEGEVEVIRSGQIKIPIYYRTKSTGFVTFRIDLI